MVKQAFNPYLPSWEYIPDGEPHVYGDRVYVYGSHDRAKGTGFCQGDYVCWSAPVTNVKEWRYEGIIYRRTQDPVYDGNMVMYAPDVTRGPDKRYYLYYVFDQLRIISVAVCSSPAGEYEFLGYVHYKDGTRLGERKGDLRQFDPAVLTEGEQTYLYTGFQQFGSMVTILGKDMLTIEQEPMVFLPQGDYTLTKGKLIDLLNEKVAELECPYKMVNLDNWAGYKGYGFFEASSIRKIDDTYYFIYSCKPENNELVYATSKSPTDGFVFKGVIVSNSDLNIDTYKPAEMKSHCGGNNHGSIEKINGEWYIFYHRHTNGGSYSRQGCAEKIKIEENGDIKQVEITSCGLNGGPLLGKGEYPAYIACHLFNVKSDGSILPNKQVLKVTQDGEDADDGTPIEGIENAELTSYVTGIGNNDAIGFKYFDFKDIKKVSVKVRATLNGYFEVKTEWDGEVFGKIEVNCSSDSWEEFSGDVAIPNGVSAFYLKFIKTDNENNERGDLRSVSFE